MDAITSTPGVSIAPIHQAKSGPPDTCDSSSSMLYKNMQQSLLMAKTVAKSEFEVIFRSKALEFLQKSLCSAKHAKML